jgi:Mrp family chromosome partitioning ATPase
MENSSPGAVYLASAALPPLHAARAKVLRNGFILVLAGLVIALGSALIAHNLDKRVYTAQDVERVLGFAPMAQIPDLLEVGTGVTEEYMLRLAAAVEHAHQQGMLNSCIFTGIAAGAGVTTVSSRVSSMLEAMGRETVLVDAVGAPQARLGEPAGNPGTDLVHAPRGSRSTALLQQMNKEAGEDSVVVTDTAPLLVSGETEYLARFVDSAIVVIESGVTTKAQLREVAQTLQRLEVSSVGFVLNRISLEHANAGFRESVCAVESHLNSQARPADATPFRPVPLQEAPPESVQEFQHLWSAPAAAHENVTAAETRQVVEPVAEAPFAAPAKPSMVMPTPEQVVESAVPASAHTEFAPAERWGLPQYTRSFAAPRTEVAAEETVAIPAAAVDATAIASEPSMDQKQTEAFEKAQDQAVAEDQLKLQERPAAHSPSRAHVARPMRGRQTVRFTSAVENKQQAVTSDLVVQEEHSVVLNEPMPESAPEPVKAEVAADETVVFPAAETTKVWDFTESTAVRKTYWAEIHEPSIAEPLVAEAPEAITSDETVVFAPIPEPEPVAVAVGGLGEDTEETPSIAASRLSGLRTLMTSLGVKNLHKELELRKTQLELAPVLERPIERPVYAQPETPAALATGTIEMPVREVTARPEIIPPRIAAVEPVERESDLRRPVKSPRVSRWDTVDDVEILPSKRGQYRKRH